MKRVLSLAVSWLRESRGTSATAGIQYTSIYHVQSTRSSAYTLKWPAARHSCSKRAFKQKCLQLAFERTVVH